MKRYRSMILAALLSLPCVATEAAVVSFSDSSYQVVVGSRAEFEVEIQYEAGEAGNLFSFGVRLLASPDVKVVRNAIVAVPELDHFGIGGSGAFTDLTPAVSGIKGTIDVTPPVSVYSGAQIATFDLTFEEVGTYQLSLELFNTLGPTEQIFVAGDGEVLDDKITFQGAEVVVVIPEPGSAVLLVLALSVVALGRRRGRLR